MSMIVSFREVNGTLLADLRRGLGRCQDTAPARF